MRLTLHGPKLIFFNLYLPEVKAWWHRLQILGYWLHDTVLGWSQFLAGAYGVGRWLPLCYCRFQHTWRPIFWHKPPRLCKKTRVNIYPWFHLLLNFLKIELNFLPKWNLVGKKLSLVAHRFGCVEFRRIVIVYFKAVLVEKIKTNSTHPNCCAIEDIQLKLWNFIAFSLKAREVFR